MSTDFLIVIIIIKIIIIIIIIIGKPGQRKNCKTALTSE